MRIEPRTGQYPTVSAYTYILRLLMMMMSMSVAPSVISADIITRYLN